MPSHLHERFVALVEDFIADAVAALVHSLRAKDMQIANRLEQVYKGRSASVELRAPKEVEALYASQRLSRRNPDASFYHPSQPHLPCLVVEVSYSQRQKDLPHLAERYIVNSQHAIKCVVGLKIAYPRSEHRKQATLSVWRARVQDLEADEKVGPCSKDVDTEVFCDKAGLPGEGSLKLYVHDVLPASSDSAHLPHINVPYHKLASLLAIAEGKIEPVQSPTQLPTPPATPPKHRKIGTGDGPAQLPSPPITPLKFRKRKRTHPEESLPESKSDPRSVEAGFDAQLRRNSKRRRGEPTPTKPMRRSSRSQ